MAHLTPFNMQQAASDRDSQVNRVYGVPVHSIAEPAGYCFNGDFREPLLSDCFLTRALEVAEKTDRMRVDGPRIILLEWGKNLRYAPISSRAKELIEDGWKSKLPLKVCSSLSGVTTAVVLSYYEHFEMVEWRRGRMNGL